MFRLGYRDTKNADRLGHRDTKNADRLGHRDTKNEDNLGQIGKPEKERKKEEK